MRRIAAEVATSAQLFDSRASCPQLKTVKEIILMTKETVSTTAIDNNSAAAAVIADSKLLSKLEAARSAQKEAYDAYVASLPQASETDVIDICVEINEGVRPSTSVPKLVTVTEELVLRIDKDTPAYSMVADAIARRKVYLKSKRGRAKVDKTVGEMTCVSFTLRTKKTKGKGTSSRATAVFES